jgi:hypothetical protein
MSALLWKLAVVIVAGSGVVGCGATLEQLPITAADAFALDQQTLDHHLDIDTFTVQASRDGALTAAEEALARAGFLVEAPASTAERRCGSRQSSLGGGTTWACFYVRRQPPDQTTVRVVTATWQPLSAIAGGRASTRELASALKVRLADQRAR